MGLRAFAVVVLLCVCIGAAAQQDDSPGGNVWLFVFDNGEPVAGVDMLVDGERVDTSSPAGAIYTEIAPGRHPVVLERDGEKLVELDLLTAEEEDVQILVTLREGQRPDVAIQSSGGGSRLAGEDQRRREAESLNPGLLEGQVISAEDDSPISGARIFVAGTDRQVTTNVAGQYQIELPPGNYTLSIVHPDFSAQTLEDIRVIPGQSITASVDLAPSGVQLAEYTVTAPYIEGSVASTFTQQREAGGVTEVIGAEQFSRTGDSDAAEALQRVSGITLEQGKFIVIRGQPSRYTYAQFNGSPLPSPDPVRQAVPLDLFPAGVLQSIEVQKAYSVDKPGGFGSGLVSLNTRGVPKSGFAEIEVSTGANSASTGETGATYDGGVEDFLGQDNGARELPDAVTNAGDSLSSVSSDAERNRIGRSFNDVFLVETMDLPADVGLSASAGNGISTDYGRFGFLVGGSYDHEYRQITDRDVTYEGSSDELRVRQDITERRTDRNVQISGLAVLNAEWDNHAVSLNNFFIRDTTDRTQIGDGINTTSDDDLERQFLLEFNRRETLLHQLVGEHDFGFVQLDWRAQTADGERDRPDRRTWNYRKGIGSTGPAVFDAEDALQREFNEVSDDIDSYGLDLTFPLPETVGIESTVKLGLANSEQSRESTTRRFNFEPIAGADLTQPIPELIINDFTIGDTVTFGERTLGTDDYTGEAEISGLYAMADIRIRDVLRVVGGVRREDADYAIDTFEAQGGSGRNVASGFDRSDTLPALSLTWFATENTQIRASTNRTVSYPLLVELSDTPFLDPDTGQQFVGNPELEPTEIESLDLRWEWYPSATESLSVGVFAKDFTNPIEQEFLPLAGGNSRIQYVNAESGEVNGIELTGRAGLGWLRGLGIVPDWRLLTNSYLQGNLTFTDSEVTVGEGGIASSTTRSMQGQAENVLNLQLGYDGDIHDWTLAVNRVGERLQTAGVQGRPDVVQEPSTFIDFTYSFSFLERATLKLSAENLLNEEITYLQGSALKRRIIFGRTYGASLGWRFF